MKATEQRKVRPVGRPDRARRRPGRPGRGAQRPPPRGRPDSGRWSRSAGCSPHWPSRTIPAPGSAARRSTAWRGSAIARAARRSSGSPGPEAPAAAQPWAIAALATLDPKAGARRAADWLAESPAAGRDEEAVEAVVGRLAQVQAGPAALVAALAGKTLPKDVAKVAIRASRSTGREYPALIEALGRAASLQEPPGPLTPEQTAALAARALRQGDPARGEAVFRRKETLCLKCHAIAGAGGQVGPSLESVGASAPADYLVDSLLQPNKAVKEGYHAITVGLNDGRVVTGIKLRQTDTALVLRDADDREVSLPLAAIDEQKPAGSLMPAGLVEAMTESELLDLVRFLSELGKIGPYAVSKEQVMRRWQVLEMNPEAVQALRRTSLDAAIVEPSLAWSPAYSTVAGVLPLDAIPRVARRHEPVLRPARGGGRPRAGRRLDRRRDQAVLQWRGGALALGRWGTRAGAGAGGGETHARAGRPHRDGGGRSCEEARGGAGDARGGSGVAGRAQVVLGK